MSSLQIDHSGRFFSKLLSKEASAPNTSSSRLLYYGGASRSIPFLWETCPGTPKRTTAPCSYSLDYADEFKFKPFLTPPPYYVSCSGSKNSEKVRRGPRFLSTLVLKLGKKKSVLSPTCSVSSSKSSSSTWLSSAASHTPFTQMTKWFEERYVLFLCSRFDGGGNDDDVTGRDKGASSPVGFGHQKGSKLRERLNEIGNRIQRDQNRGGGGGDASSNYMGRRHMLGPLGALNTITPCAACKLLRRRCAQECPFSPYFSPHEPHKFASVHKVFGASNISKMLMDVPECQRADAANSLVYEANVRLRDPVYGCMGAISALQQQVQNLQAELNVVRGEILKYKYREAAAAGGLLPSSYHQHLTLFSSDAVSVTVPPSASPQPQSQPQPIHVPPPLLNSSSSSSAFTRPGSSAATDYSTITSENPSYFG